MFGERLRLLRTERLLSQKELGKLLSLSKQTISSYENGTRQPDVDTLKYLANYFNVSIDYLLGYKDSKEIDLHDALEDNTTHIKVAGTPLTYEQRKRILEIICEEKQLYETKNETKEEKINSGDVAIDFDNRDLMESITISDEFQGILENIVERILKKKEREKKENNND